MKLVKRLLEAESKNLMVLTIFALDQVEFQILPNSEKFLNVRPNALIVQDSLDRGLDSRFPIDQGAIAVETYAKEIASREDISRYAYQE